MSDTESDDDDAETTEQTSAESPEPDDDNAETDEHTNRKSPEPDSDDAKTAEQANARTRRIREYLEDTGLAVLVLFALLAAFRFYGHTSAAISEFISPAYRSLFKALFNLVVLLVSAGGIAVLLARRDRE